MAAASRGTGSDVAANQGLEVSLQPLQPLQPCLGPRLLSHLCFRPHSPIPPMLLIRFGIEPLSGQSPAPAARWRPSSRTECSSPAGDPARPGAGPLLLLIQPG